MSAATELNGLPLARPFPSPSELVTDAITQLRLVMSSSPATEDQLREAATLDRPWDPASCRPELRDVIYRWLDQVVAWINEEHAWRVDRMVPLCWPEHPHIVHELATVACLRLEATNTSSADALSEWQRHVLPEFLDRTAGRIGGTGCPPGRHHFHPGRTRNLAYREEERSRARRARYHLDTEQNRAAPPPL